MKAASVIAKLPIVSINEGDQIALVKDLLVGRKSKKVEYLSVVQGKSSVVPRVIAFSELLGIGKEFIITQTEDNIKVSADVISEGEEFIHLTGTTVISAMGDYAGIIKDWELDEKTGFVSKIILDNASEIENEKLLSLSQKFILANLDGMDIPTASESTTAETPAANEAAEDTEELDQGTISYLLGKTVNADVSSADGAFNVTAGTTLTESLVRDAQRHGALIDLTMNV
ncbi:MAG: hypothetical protein LBQ95_08905 [Lachnospiraceae bacterium]|jgi:sporulation protein YlmC with PRC-barrel domain|nr:hypothetical protein [Lachnospiraceae bacterium]